MIRYLTELYVIWRDIQNKSKPISKECPCDECENNEDCNSSNAEHCCDLCRYKNGIDVDCSQCNPYEFFKSKIESKEISMSEVIDMINLIKQELEEG